jgi:hypothetical protein
MAKSTSGRSSRGVGAPHQTIEAADGRERFTLQLFDALWSEYRQRVSYVRDYENVVAAAGGTFVNDHIAFRTLAAQQPMSGIASISRIFEALGYEPAGLYRFPDKSLFSIHYQHANSRFPKLFISELRSWELSAAAQKILGRTIAGSRNPWTVAQLSALRSIDQAPAATRDKLLGSLVRFFRQPAWPAPKKSDVEVINKESQFGAWVMVHGYAVNHFTALVNSHGASAISDIDKTVAALTSAGVPMKKDIEGAPGSKLRQTATEAVVVDVPMRQGAKRIRSPWTYAYFEIAERGEVLDPASGKSARFEGFLGPQATQLFEMTRLGSRR